jgi:hypothetical protein
MYSRIEAMKIKADNDSTCIMLTSSAGAEAAEQSSQALKKQAKAESDNAAKLAIKRDYLEKLQRTKSETTMAQNSKMVISGKNAEKMLGFYSEASQIAQ